MTSPITKIKAPASNFPPPHRLSASRVFSGCKRDKSRQTYDSGTHLALWYDSTGSPNLLMHVLSTLAGSPEEQMESYQLWWIPEEFLCIHCIFLYIFLCLFCVSPLCVLRVSTTLSEMCCFLMTTSIMTTGVESVWDISFRPWRSFLFSWFFKIKKLNSRIFPKQKSSVKDIIQSLLVSLGLEFLLPFLSFLCSSCEDFQF